MDNWSNWVIWLLLASKMSRFEYMGNFNGDKSSMKLFDMFNSHVWDGMNGGNWDKFENEQSNFNEIETRVLADDDDGLNILFLFSVFPTTTVEVKVEKGVVISSLEFEVSYSILMTWSSSGWIVVEEGWKCPPSLCNAYRLHFLQIVLSTVAHVSSNSWQM